jgi:hypothetical protein
MDYCHNSIKIHGFKGFWAARHFDGGAQSDVHIVARGYCGQQCRVGKVCHHMRCELGVCHCRGAPAHAVHSAVGIVGQQQLQ